MFYKNITHFHVNLIPDIVIAEYKKNLKASPVTIKKFCKSVGMVINSAKDWEGYRSFRAKKKEIDIHDELKDS